jgi:hypothetical protein
MSITVFILKMIRCEICRRKLEELENFEIKVYHMWMEHQKILDDKEIDGFFHKCEI